MLIELFPITGNAAVPEPRGDGGRELIAGGGEQPAAGEGFQEQARQSVARAIDEPDGVGFRRQQVAAFRDGGIKKVEHEGADCSGGWRASQAM